MALPNVGQHPRSLMRLFSCYEDAVNAIDFYQLRSVPRGFVNLTPYTVSSSMSALLSYGPKFMLPRTTNVVDLIGDFGKLHNYLQKMFGNLDPSQVFLELFHKHRREVEELFKGRTLSNVEIALRHALNDVHSFFQAHPDACIIQSDKGNTTCLMLVADYKRKMQTYVDKSLSEGVFVLATDARLKVAVASFSHLRRDLRTALFSDPWVSRLPKDLFDKLMSTTTRKTGLPSLYGMVKCHKDGAPMRPICSTLHWLSRPIQKILLWVLKDCFSARLSAENVTRIDDVVRDLAGLRLRPGYVFVKFDIKNMYGTLDKDKIGQMLVTFLSHPDIIDTCVLSKFLVMRLYHYSMYLSSLVTYDGNTFHQMKGLPQGACDSGFLATLYLDTIFQVYNEELFLSHKVCRFWKYMDDLLLYMPSKYVPYFKTSFERITDLELDVEYLEEVTTGKMYDLGVRSTISFLDVNISIMEDGTLCTSEYRKPIASARMINALSNTVIDYKVNTLKAFLQKILKRTSNPLLIHDYNNLYERALENNYPDGMLSHLFHGVFVAERASLIRGQCYLPLKGPDIMARIEIVSNLMSTMQCDDTEIVQVLREQSLGASGRSKVVFPYRSVTLSRLLCMGCAYGGIPLPVYSRMDQSSYLARFFSNRRLTAVVESVTAHRTPFNVGLLRCMQCDVVFVISGRNRLDKIADMELAGVDGDIIRHQNTFGHTVSPVVQRLRNIHNVDSAYTSVIYKALFGAVGVSCVSQDFLAQVPVFVRCLLGYMQGIGRENVLIPSLVGVPIHSPDVFSGLSDAELCAVMDDFNAMDNFSVSESGAGCLDATLADTTSMQPLLLDHSASDEDLQDVAAGGGGGEHAGAELEAALEFVFNDSGAGVTSTF